MKANKKEIAKERIQILINNAISYSSKNPNLSERQAFLAKRISTKYRIPLPYDIRIMFCKKCKKFIVPGINSRIRLGRTNSKSIRITCNFCFHTYRKIISQ